MVAARIEPIFEKEAREWQPTSTGGRKPRPLI